jgi:flavin reductase (DIM6/NTAB) family NADH-FMN oxidoreductase RutF
MVVKSDGLDSFLHGLDTPMFIVTAVHRDTSARGGCLVGFASQCSIAPDRFVVWLSQHNHTYRIAQEATVLAVHGLAEGQRDLAELFGTRTGDEIDKFAQCSWRAGPGGVPILDDCRRWFVGDIQETAVWGNHTGFLLTPREAGDPTDVAPLMYSAVCDLTAGHPA